MRRFKVFMRVVGTVAMDTEADSPDEAAEKASDAIGTDDEPEFLSMDVKWANIETAFPVAYNDPDNGDTIDLAVPEELREAEAKNALVGIGIWALSELVVDENGIVGDPRVSFFLSNKRAFLEMTRRYQNAKLVCEENGDLDMLAPPDGDGNGCSVSTKMGACMTWSITKAKIE